MTSLNLPAMQDVLDVLSLFIVKPDGIAYSAMTNSQHGGQWWTTREKKALSAWLRMLKENCGPRIQPSAAKNPFLHLYSAEVKQHKIHFCKTWAWESPAEEVESWMLMSACRLLPRREQISFERNICSGELLLFCVHPGREVQTWWISQ